MNVNWLPSPAFRLPWIQRSTQPQNTTLGFWYRLSTIYTSATGLQNLSFYLFTWASFCLRTRRFVYLRVVFCLLWRFIYLFVFMYESLFTCVSLFGYLYEFVCLPVCLSVRMFVYLCEPLFVYLCDWVTCLFVFSVRIFVNVYDSLFVCLCAFDCLSVGDFFACLFACLSAALSVHVFLFVAPRVRVKPRQSWPCSANS